MPDVPAFEPRVFFQQVGRRLHELRTRHGWTLERMSSQAGMAVQNYARIEKGQNLTLEMLLRLSRILAVAPHELLLPPETEPLEAVDVIDPLSYLTATGWRHAESTPRPARAVPAFDLASGRWA